MTRVKICGLNTLDAVRHAVNCGADALGFIHFEKSPRHVSLDQAHSIGAALGPSKQGPLRVGVMVNPTLETVKAFARALDLNVVQLHGSETPEDCKRLRRETGLQVWKVISVENEADLDQMSSYENFVDAFLFDAKPPAGSDLPGGNARAFPWHLMTTQTPSIPWWLAGGLTPNNVEAAIEEAKAPGVDVASGTESAPGIKSLSLISDFIAAAKGAKTRA